jgi:ABC-type polysaccharide/polyol phosphate transport system ATPase subunit
VREGEFFGIVGRNGSGKSTLLKCLAGIYAIDAGDIAVHGRLSPFIELGVGFNPDLTARDNVIINAIMLGATRKEARERFDEVIRFAELEEFVDLKLKNYSSGMSVRLGFSVAVQVEADVLLVDEVLAVGDAAFQRKCFDQFERMKAEGRTILFVTHDMGAIERFCDRAMLIERGRILDIGAPGDISREYSEINHGQMPDATAAGGGARILTAWCEDADGERVVSSRQGETCAACVELEFVSDVEDPELTITFRNDVRHTIFVATTARHPGLGRFHAGERAIVRLGFENWLAPSRYTLSPSVSTKQGIDRRHDLASLIVDGGRTGGVADLPTELGLERL